MMSMITPANRNAAVIIVNRRRDHEFVIIAPVNSECMRVVLHIYEGFTSYIITIIAPTNGRILTPDVRVLS